MWTTIIIAFAAFWAGFFIASLLALAKDGDPERRDQTWR